jgi:hypothetical protein
MEDFLAREMSNRRLRFIRRYDYRDGDGFAGYNDLYAVIKTEPQTISEEGSPPRASYWDYQSRWRHLPPGFRDSGFLFYCLYKIAFGRAPTFSEYTSGVAGFEFDSTNPTQQIAQRAKALVERFINQTAFKAAYDGKANAAFLRELAANAAIAPDLGERDTLNTLTKGLNSGVETRSTLLQKMAVNDALLLREFDRAFLVMSYFAYLRRDPDPSGYDFWLSKLDESGDYGSVARSFRTSYEHSRIFSQPWL